MGASSWRPARRGTNTTFTHWALRSWRFHPPSRGCRPSRRPQLHSPPGPGFVCGLFALHSPLLSESQLFSPPALSDMLEFSAWPCTAEVATVSEVARTGSEPRQKGRPQGPESSGTACPCARPDPGPCLAAGGRRLPPPSAPHAGPNAAGGKRPDDQLAYDPRPYTIGDSQCSIAFGASMILIHVQFTQSYRALIRPSSIHKPIHPDRKSVV